MKISNKPPHKISTELDAQIQELIKEFEYLMYCERLAEAYREQNHQKNNNHYK